MTTKRTNPKSKARRVSSHVLAKGKGAAVARRHRKSTCEAINLESLENRQLMSVVNVADFGAKPNDNADDRAAIQAAVNAAKAGDTINFAAGKYDINGQLMIGSDRTLTGASNHGSTLAFHTGNNQFGMILQNPNNVTIKGLSLRGNCGLIIANGTTNNVSIVDNDMQWGDAGTYFTRVAFRGYNGNNNLKIERNFFHDSPNSDRTVDLWNTTNTSYSYNKFYDVFDGGHIDGLHHHLRVVGNVAKRFHRMGLELQNNNNFTPGNAGDDIVVANNVFTEWYQPWYDSFGLSIMPQNATNVVVSGNYMSVYAFGQTAPTGGYGQGGRAGYGIEFGCDTGTGIAQNNTLVGPWVSAITVSMPNSKLKNNKSYGNNAWGSFSTEPGNNALGHGTITDLGGNQTLALAQAPAPTDPTGGDTIGGGGGGDTVGGGDGTDTTAIGVTNVAARSLSNDRVQLAWKTSGITGIKAIRIEIFATVSGEKFQSLTITGQAVSAVLTNLHPGWQLSFKVVAVTSAAEYAGTPVSAQVDGDANATFTDTGAKLVMAQLSDGTIVNGDLGDGTTEQTTGIGVNNVQAQVINDHTVKLTWTTLKLTGIKGYRVDIKASHSGQVFKSVTFQGAITGALITPVHPGWHLDFTVVAITTKGNVAAKPVSALMTGNAFGDFTDTGAFGSVPLKRKRYMTDARLVHSENKLGNPEKNQSNGGASSNDGSAMTIDGRSFTRGVGVTAASKLAYALGGKYKTFASYIGLDDEAENSGTVTFQVWGDGKLLYDSGTVNDASRARKLSVNVQGVNQLWLVVTPAHGGVKNANVHADWAQSYLLAA